MASPPDADRLAFGIHCRNLQFAVADWKELAGVSDQVPEHSLACAFQVGDWEDLLSLRLSFGETQGTRIEVSAEGVGLVESAPDFFTDPQAHFSIHAWAQFLGVSIHVPVNAASFTDYAQAKLRTMLPRYAHGQPTIRRGLGDSGTLRGVEVFYPPS